ncbi:MAG: glycerol-3-phosphate 1-O-acyltransferase, partial [Gammaproteobacteria bacterium]|nr:glycerol-3-phosphate 1-O-acyltransferase [Gammaproteobacteria bacterium]
LLALPLLSAPRQAMLEEVLVTHLDMSLALLREAPYAELITIPETSGHGILRYAIEMDLVRRREHPLGDVIVAEGDDAILMTYNRNNVMHLFALPSMVACCFLNNRQMRVDKIADLGRMVYRYIRAELFLHWSGSEFEERIRRILGVLVDHDLLEWVDDGDGCRRPPADSGKAVQLSLLAQGALQTLERYYMTIALLLKHGSGRVSQSDLENLCQLMAQRMSMLYQFDAPEFFAKPLFRDFIDSLRDTGVVWTNDNGLLEFDDRIRGVDEDAKLVLGEQIRHSILQVTHM